MQEAAFVSDELRIMHETRAAVASHAHHFGKFMTYARNETLSSSLEEQSSSEEQTPQVSTPVLLSQFLLPPRSKTHSMS